MSEVETVILKQRETLPKCPTPRCGNVREIRDPFCAECWPRVDKVCRRALHEELKVLRARRQKNASPRYIQLLVECVRSAFKNRPAVKP